MEWHLRAAIQVPPPSDCKPQDITSSAAQKDLRVPPPSNNIPFSAKLYNQIPPDLRPARTTNSGEMQLLQV